MNSDEQRANFNTALAGNLAQGHLTLHDWQTSVIQAAETALTKQTTAPKHRHIRNGAMELIRQRQALRDSHAPQHVIDDLTRTIKKAARKDKRQCILSQLQTGVHSRSYWKTGIYAKATPQDRLP